MFEIVIAFFSSFIALLNIISSKLGKNDMQIGLQLQPKIDFVKVAKLWKSERGIENFFKIVVFFCISVLSSLP